MTTKISKPTLGGRNHKFQKYLFFSARDFNRSISKFACCNDMQLCVSELRFQVVGNTFNDTDFLIAIFMMHMHTDELA